MSHYTCMFTKFSWYVAFKWAFQISHLYIFNFLIFFSELVPLEAVMVKCKVRSYMLSYASNSRCIYTNDWDLFNFFFKSYVFWAVSICVRAWQTTDIGVLYMYIWIRLTCFCSRDNWQDTKDAMRWYNYASNRWEWIKKIKKGFWLSKLLPFPHHGKATIFAIKMTKTLFNKRKENCVPFPSDLW